MPGLAPQKKRVEFDHRIPPDLTIKHCQKVWKFVNNMKNIENYNLISQAICKDVQLEVSGGRAIGPFEVQNPMDLLTVHERIGKDVKSGFISPRFGIIQPDKVRSSDHFSFSGDCINTRTIVNHQVTLPRFQHFAGLVQPCSKPKKLFKIDAKNAYRFLPLKEDHVPYTGVLYTTNESNVDRYWVVYSRGCPFGAVSSVSNYLRVSSAIMHLHRTVMYLQSMNYLDDFVGAEDEDECDLCFECSKAIHSFTGNLIKEEKSLKPCYQGEVLGVQTSFPMNTLMLSLTETRRFSLLNELKKILENPNLLTEKICGKISFALETINGRSGRASLRHLIRRCRGNHKDEELFQIHTKFLITLFENNNIEFTKTIRMITGSESIRIIYYSDASFENGVAVIAGVRPSQNGQEPKFFNHQITLKKNKAN